MPAALENEPPNMLTLQAFQAHVNAAFAPAQETGQSTPFVLTEARALAQEPSPGGQTPFSLLFRNAASLPQQIHTLVHPSLGEVDIFLVPVGRDGDATVYQAVFN